MHESAELPAQAKYYRDLIPLSTPQAASSTHLKSISTPALAAKRALPLATISMVWKIKSCGDLSACCMAAAISCDLAACDTACHHCVDRPVSTVVRSMPMTKIPSPASSGIWTINASVANTAF